MTVTIVAAILCIVVGIELVRRSRRPRRARITQAAPPLALTRRRARPDAARRAIAAPCAVADNPRVMENAAPALRPPRAITCRSLAWGFARIGLSGIGGVLPYAHHTIVEGEGWLTDREFTEVLSIAQILPGPNIANVAILLGTRFRGRPARRRRSAGCSSRRSSSSSRSRCSTASSPTSRG